MRETESDSKNKVGESKWWLIARRPLTGLDLSHNQLDELYRTRNGAHGPTEEGPQGGTTGQLMALGANGLFQVVNDGANGGGSGSGGGSGFGSGRENSGGMNSDDSGDEHEATKQKLMEEKLAKAFRTHCPTKQ